MKGVFATLAMLAVLFTATPAHAQTAPSARARELLAEPAFGWCHHPPRFLTPEQVEYCGYVDARSACPEFAHACEALVQPVRHGSCSGSTMASAEAAGRIAIITFVFGVALALIAWIVRNAARARRERNLVAPAVDAATDETIPLAMVSGSSAELLARAQDLAARGEFGPALFAVYAALLRGLDERGAIRIDPSFTSGDYVRHCREAALRTPLKEVSREVERVRFGGGDADAARFARVLARVEPIVRSAALVAVMVLAFATQTACARSAQPSDDHGVSGHHLARAVLESSGLKARRMVDAPEDANDTSRVVVVDSDVVSLERPQWTALIRWVERGGELVVAGPPPDLEALAEVHVETHPHVADIVMLDVSLGALFVRAHPRTHALIVPTSATVLAHYTQDDAVYAARLERGGGHVTVLAGSELLANASLAVGLNADALVAVMRGTAGDRDLEFVEDSEGAATNPIASLARAGALPVVLQALAVLALFFVARGRHFGTPRDPAETSRRAFAEHVRAVGRLYARARVSQRVVNSYGRFALERLRDRVGATRGSLAESVASRLGMNAAEVEVTIAAVERAQQNPPSRSARDELENLRLAAILNQWLRRLG